jgi:hypothetical protein
MRKILILAIVALGVANIAPLAAQPLPNETIDPAQIIPYFDVETTDATLKTVTANHLATVNPAGENIITAYAPNGLQFSFQFLQCDENIPSQCKALQLLTSWSLDGQKLNLQNIVSAFQRSHLSAAIYSSIAEHWKTVVPISRGSSLLAKAWRKASLPQKSVISLAMPPLSKVN